jgi:hypothetical protein
MALDRGKFGESVSKGVEMVNKIGVIIERPRDFRIE